MGQHPSKGDIHARSLSSQIEHQLYDQHVQHAAMIKLLLLGAGESGKSTFFKQMLKIYGPGFTKKDGLLYVPMIINNVIAAMKELCFQCQELKIADCLPSPSIKAEREYILNVLIEEDPLTPQVAAMFKKVWADKGIRNTFKRRAMFQLMDTADYFFDSIDRLAQEYYFPIDEDWIKCRVRTTGIVDHKFLIEENEFELVDVGGQRNERKKWIHCFQDVTAVLFVVAVSEYDQVLFEDGQTNRLDEALKLFASTTAMKWFQKTPFILFFNKIDLYQEKINDKIPLTVWAKNYTGSHTIDETLKYIQQKFEQSSPNTLIYSHVTCATDSESVRKVFNAVKDAIIQQHINESGI